MPTHRLSKSKILSGLQCHKKLWLEIHSPELGEESTSSLSRMQTGNIVGELAWDLLPGGKLIGLENGFSAAITETSELLSGSKITPLYEATFSHEGVLIRADLLIKEEAGLHLVEVKSSTSVKSYYLMDCAVQQWVAEGCGHQVCGFELAHIDNYFVYPGDENYDGLFHLEDISEKVNLLKTDVSGWVADFKAVLDGNMPEVETGPHCCNPFQCQFAAYCNSDDGPEYPLSCLPRAGAALIESLEDEGITDVRDIPEDHLTNETHCRVREVSISGEEFIDPAFGEYLKSLPYPRYYLDFETIQFAVPIWEGTNPYRQLPFQWSCHVENSGADILHEEFLDISGNAPMRDFAESLIATCGEEGPIFVYSHFEKTVLNKLIETYPDLAGALQAIIDRSVDLLPLTRRHYYHPEMKGSWSIKAVLPCVAPDLDYDQLEEVKDGMAAQEAFLEAISSEISDERKEDLRTKMLEYCELDTLAMVQLVRFFMR